MFFLRDLPEAELWKSSLLAAISLHAVILVAVLVAPFFSSHEFDLPKAYTVNIVSLPTASRPPTPGRQKKTTAAPARPTPKPRPTHKPKMAVPVEIPPPPAPKSEPAPVRQVSLRPMKTKKWRMPRKKAREVVRQNEINKKRLRAAKKNEKKARELEKKATSAAVDNIRALIHTQEILQTAQAPIDIPASDNSPSAATGHEGIVASTVLEQYQADVYRKIQQHWTLPPLQEWDDSLVAVVVMRVNSDGSIIDLFFEKKSPNTFFNQFVMKTVRLAAPMPPFPQEMQHSSMEFGLRFSPGGLL